MSATCSFFEKCCQRRNSGLTQGHDIYAFTSHANEVEKIADILIQTKWTLTCWYLAGIDPVGDVDAKTGQKPDDHVSQ